MISFVKQSLSIAASIFLIANPRCLADNQLLEQVNQLEQQGQFKRAAALLDAEVRKTSSSAAERKELEFELDRLERIKKDFPYTKEALFAELKKAVKDLTAAEYEQWIKEGRFDSREIDGQRYFMCSSVSNLFFRYPELGPRRLPLKETAAFEKAVWETCLAVKKAAQEQKQPYVLPKRFHVTMTVTAKPTAAPAGEVVHC